MKTTFRIITLLFAVLLTASLVSCTKINDNTKLPPELNNQIDEGQLGVEQGNVDNKGEFESVPVYWKIYDTTLYVSGNGDMTDLVEENVVPWAEYNERYDTIIVEQGVTSICDNAFKGSSFVEIAELPDTVLSIGNFAFSHCSFLKEIDIPDYVTRLGEGAYANCVNAREIDIPDTLKRIEKNTFANCFSVEEAELENVEYVGENAFAACYALTKVEFGANLTEIADGAFQMCDNLKTIEFDGTKAQWEKVKIGENNDAIKNANVKFDK